MAGRRALPLGTFVPLDEENLTLTKRWLVRVRPESLNGWLGMASFDREYDAKREWEQSVLKGMPATIIDQFKREEN